jgi:hypothetical protein
LITPHSSILPSYSLLILTRDDMFAGQTVTISQEDDDETGAMVIQLRPEHITPVNLHPDSMEEEMMGN